MARLPIIRRFNLIKNLGVFQKHPSPAGNPEFKNLNLIYGFNGSGKTTLTRIFASLEAGVLRPEIPTDAQFQIELSDGTIIKDDANLNILKGRVLVFNTDFVEANFRWKDGKANPIFYLGEEQTRLSQRLEALENSLLDVSSKLPEASRTSSSADKTFMTCKRDLAREIGEQINDARGYNASNLASDYATEKYGDEFKLSDKDRRRLRQLINADAPLPKLPLIDKPSFTLESLVSDATTVLKTTLGELAIEELSRHETMLPWTKEGLDYHQAHKLENCLFCGSVITEKRINTLEKAFNAKFDDLIHTIQAHEDKAHNINDYLKELNSRLPSEKDFSLADGLSLQLMSPSPGQCISKGIDHANSILHSLIDKEKHLNSAIDASDVPTANAAKTWDEQLASAISQLNSIIQNHNASHDQFYQSQAEAGNRLKLHYLAEGQTQYFELMRVAVDEKERFEKIQAQAHDLENQIAELRQSLREHGPAATKINDFLGSYLGHRTLQIEAVKEGEEGYAIMRDHKPISGPLSEGEKTAICYLLLFVDDRSRRARFARLNCCR